MPRPTWESISEQSDLFFSYGESLLLEEPISHMKHQLLLELKSATSQTSCMLWKLANTAKGLLSLSPA